MDSAEAVAAGSRPLSSDALRAIALATGFDLCGFARVEPIPAATLTEWLDAGMAAEMDWMRERAADRLDVTRLLPGARTVISLASNYHQDAPPSPIARYARGRDYHATHKDRIRGLRRELKQRWPSIRTYGGVDYVPLMEKVWATRAGLGYVGKNGCLITERFGSWVLLATLVIDAEVDRYAESIATDRCGKCNLCVTACPTDAILEDRRVDARACLSYQTIENRSAGIPEAFRSAMAEIVFGCDVCQTVCPLNDAPLNGHARFAPRAIASLTVRELAALTPEQYETLIPGTPLARAKYDGLRRNAAYALGAGKDRESQPLLERLALDPAPLVRDAARWALAQIEAIKKPA